jgi:hypothetical protein
MPLGKKASWSGLQTRVHRLQADNADRHRFRPAIDDSQLDLVPVRANVG